MGTNRRPLALLHYASRPQGATKLKPFGRVGPYAPLTKTLLFRYQIAVRRVPVLDNT